MPEISQEQFAEVIAARALKPPTPWRTLAARYGVRHTSLMRKHQRYEAAQAEQRKAERAARAAEDPAKPETLRLRQPGEPVPVAVNTNGPPSWPIGSTAPDPYLDWDPRHVHTAELLQDDRGRIDLTEKVRSHPAPDPMRAHR